MVEHKLQTLASAQPVARSRSRMPLGAQLVLSGVITRTQLDHALHLQQRLQAPLGEILVTEGWATRAEVLTALSDQSGIQITDLSETPPSPKLCRLRPVGFWLEHNLIPWMQMGPVLLIATSRPDLFEHATQSLRSEGLTPVPVLADATQIDVAIGEAFSADLAEAAEARIAPLYSCRNWHGWSRFQAAMVLTTLICVLIMIPGLLVSTLFLLSVLTLILFMSLRFSGLCAHILGRQRQRAGPIPTNKTRLPRISILVPLYKEREVAGILIKRLQRLTYPKALLDVILVLEEKDHVTRQTLSNIALPSWIRIIEVPDHNGLTTKPRAMNYALDFCRGEVVGVWDAEDAPQHDQIEQVVERFARAPDDVVCLQGVLDYYNPRTNWRSRCFTIEYCSWFRVILPGIARLGLVVPLGGTTFFFRRDKLIELGGWDAHNVTEDADLGVRLYRAGYRTELIPTTTFEEANFRAWPWIKQRSRWLKGFMVTYLVHMRAPLRLLRELGIWRFIGVQAFFLGTLGQFLLAPVMWLFWLVYFDIPLLPALSPALVLTASAIFIGAEFINMLAGLIAVSSRDRSFLIPWVPTMMLYFPLGVIAAYKALWELAVDPFFWDKTQHGQAAEEQPAT